MRPPFLDDRRSDLIETCQEYCRGPADVPFQGLRSIGWAVPKLRPCICETMTWHGAMTSRMTSQLMFIYLFIYFCTIDVTILLLLRLVWRHNRSWGPEYVPFQGLILIGQAVPKLRPFICQPMTIHGAMTSRMTSQLMFIYLFLFIL